jgi:transcriptional regulator with XRE-family HTH domain
MKIVGINIKRLRETKGISLRELSRKLNVSASFISQIETNKSNPSLASLKNIATALGTTVGSLVGEEMSENNSLLVRENERKSLEKIHGINMYLLNSADPNNQMEALLFRLDKNANSGKMMYKHFGQEFVYVLEGELEIVLNEKHYILKKGDTIYFNSSTPHSFGNLHKGKTEALWVVTPPTF